MSEETDAYDARAVWVVRWLSAPADVSAREVRKELFYVDRVRRAYVELPARLGQAGFERAYDIVHDLSDGLQVLDVAPELAASYFSRAFELWEKE